MSPGSSCFPPGLTPFDHGDPQEARAATLQSLFRKRGGQVPSRLHPQGLQASETPSLPGDCLAGQGIFLGPGFGGGHGVCTRPLPPSSMAPGPSRTRWRAALWGRSQGGGLGESKTPQKPALLSWETEGEPSLSWGGGGRPGVWSPQGPRHPSWEPEQMGRVKPTGQRETGAGRGGRGANRLPKGGDPSEDQARQTRNTSSRWPDGLAQLQHPLGKLVQAKGKGDTPTVSALRADAPAVGRVHALLLTPPAGLGVEVRGGGWTSSAAGEAPCWGGEGASGTSTGCLLWSCGPQLRPGRSRRGGTGESSPRERGSRCER